MTTQLIVTISFLSFFVILLQPNGFFPLTVDWRINFSWYSVKIRKKLLLITQIPLICLKNAHLFNSNSPIGHCFELSLFLPVFIRQNFGFCLLPRLILYFVYPRLGMTGDTISKILSMYGILVSVFPFVSSNETKEPSFDCFQYETIFWSLD